MNWYFLKKLLLTFCVVFSTANAATVLSLSQNWNGTLFIPDNDATGVTRTFTFATGIGFVTDVNLILEVEGGWKGDFYGYVFHNGKIASIMNRVGRTTANPFGFGLGGFLLGFDDQAMADVHTSLAATGLATGVFQPDGRIVDPDFVLDTDARTNLLSIFNGENADGDWTVFIADLGSGDSGILKSVTIELSVVPEPSTMILLLGSSTIMLRRKRGQAK